MNMVILSESDGKIFMVIIFIIAIGMRLQFVAGCLASSLIRVMFYLIVTESRCASRSMVSLKHVIVCTYVCTHKPGDY